MFCDHSKDVEMTRNKSGAHRWKTWGRTVRTTLQFSEECLIFKMMWKLLFCPSQQNPAYKHFENTVHHDVPQLTGDARNSPVNSINSVLRPQISTRLIDQRELLEEERERGSRLRQQAQNASSSGRHCSTPRRSREQPAAEPQRSCQTRWTFSRH